MKKGRKYYLDRSLRDDRIIADEYECMVTCDYMDIFEGYGAMTRIIKSGADMVIKRNGKPLTIAADGYTWIQALPLKEKYSVILMLDENMEIIQWYFDITWENGVDDDGEPYSIDAYLDLVLYPDGEMAILDEDELEAALKNGDITKEEFAAAYESLNALIDYLKNNIDDFMEKSDRYIEYFMMFE